MKKPNVSVIYFSPYIERVLNILPKREAITKGEHFLCEECYVPFGRGI